MKIFLTIICVLTCSGVFAQGGGYGAPSKISGKITGTLVDSASNEVLPFAAVVVKNAKGDKDINGTVTEDDGSFKFTSIPVGEHNLVISFVGYEPRTIPVVMTDKKPDVDLGNVKLVSSTKQLDEVVVQGQRDLIENKIDKIVYNAERDVANDGGDGADVLRRAPLLNVDLDGNVSLRGSSNVRILINGKPSSMFASNPGDALKSIPADQIKSVEVITTPGAKYDGEGTAGIINIITKKSGPEGFAGNTDISVGNRNNRGSLNLNYGRGRFGVNASGSAFYSPAQLGTSKLNRTNFRDGQTITFSDNGDVKTTFLGYFANAGAFYDFNAFNSISTSFRLRAFNRTSDGDYTTILEDPTQNLYQNYQRSDESESQNAGYEWSLDYIKKFEGHEGRELSLSYKLDGNISDQDNVIFQQDLIDSDTELFRDEKNTNNGDNKENTFQLDYVHPVNKDVKIEAGGKSVFRDVVSDFTYLQREQNETNYTIDEAQSDLFNYNQDVMAGYVSVNYALTESIGVLAGVRYEHTTIEGDLEDDQNQFSNQYDNFLPSITVNKNLTKTTTIKASYNRRIQRPGLRQINPYEENNNSLNISYGNPYLNPEIVNQVELNMNTYLGKIMLNASVYYRNTDDVIEQITQIDDDNVSVTTYENIGQQNAVGLNLFSSATLFKIWTIRGGVNMNTYEASGVIGGESVSRNAFVYNGNINSNLELKNNWTIDLFGFYRARQQTIQGYVPSFSIMALGAKKTFWDDRASVGIRIIEPFFENKVFKSKIEGENYVQTSEMTRPFRSFGITLGYKFGKLDYKQRQRRSKIQNNDIKDTGGQDNQGQY